MRNRLDPRAGIRTLRSLRPTWELLDSFVHAVGVCRLVPAPVTDWVCDRYDRSLGLYDRDQGDDPGAATRPSDSAEVAGTVERQNPEGAS